MPTPPEDDGRTAVEKWRQLKHRCRTYMERLHVLQVACAIHLVFQQKWNHELAQLQVSSAPAMLCYMSDGWSAWLWKVSRRQNGRSASMTWSHERTEFLLQRALLKIEMTGGTEAAIWFDPPRPMTEGKTAWHVYSALDEFHLPLRHYTRGPTVFFGIFDGLHLS